MVVPPSAVVTVISAAAVARADGDLGAGRRREGDVQIAVEGVGDLGPHVEIAQVAPGANPDGRVGGRKVRNRQVIRHASPGRGEHGGIRAMYDGKIRLPSVDDNTDLTTFQSLMVHEYTHALVYYLAGPKCPIWLNEGLAQIQENTVIPVSQPGLRMACGRDDRAPTAICLVMSWMFGR